MRRALILLTIADLALALLLISISGYVLEGVNNTGPQMPEALFFILLLLGAFTAPALAWALRHRIDGAGTIAIAAAPLVIGAGILLLEP